MKSMSLLSELDTDRWPVFPNASTLEGLRDGIDDMDIENPLDDWAPVSLGIRRWQLLTGIQSSSLTIGTVESPEKAQAEWKAALIQQIDYLASLQPGWDTYSAPRIDLEIIEDAKRLVSRLANPGVPAPAAVPTINGTVQLEWHTRKCDAEIEILELGRYHVFSHPAGSEPWEGELDFEAALTKIRPLLD